MQQLICTVKCNTVLHARPAGEISRAAKVYEDTFITITKGEMTVKASQLIRLMSLAIKNGDEITVTAEGPHEQESIVTMRNLLEGGLS